jgi:hypothetical protein
MISRNTNKDISLLYACAIEAQQSGHGGLGIRALETLLEKHNQGATSGLHLPALLRFLGPYFSRLQ